MEKHIPYPKTKAERLSYLKLKKLQEEVLTRDSFRCLISGEATEEPFHHIVYKSQGGSDISENAATLCNRIHTEIHHGDMNKVVKEIANQFSAHDVVKYFLLGLVNQK